MLQAQPQTVDFSAYRSQLQNTAVVDEIEGFFKTFTPAKVDLARQLKALEAFEAQAVQSARETKGKVDEQLADLEKTLKNIQETRSVDELTVVSIFFPSYLSPLLLLPRTVGSEHNSLKRAGIKCR